jgi:tRNA(Ile2) C34 agmatinyltransferase TiaS
MSEEKVYKANVIYDGPMGEYDAADKPTCPDHGKTWVVSCGNDTSWTWRCTNCQTELPKKKKVVP